MRIAVIPARFGSKRIKKKNIKNFYSKPMIYWAIKRIRERLFKGKREG
jgi:N-acylneuraminate cytidylyltransferase